MKLTQEISTPCGRFFHISKKKNFKSMQKFTRISQAKIWGNKKATSQLFRYPCNIWRHVQTVICYRDRTGSCLRNSHHTFECCFQHHLCIICLVCLNSGVMIISNDCINGILSYGKTCLYNNNNVYIRTEMFEVICYL